MARVLGYGGLGNTEGARSFAGKEEAEELGSKILGCADILDVVKITMWVLAMGVLDAVS